MNLPASRVIDIVFGFLPAVFVGFWALVGIISSFPPLFSGNSNRVNYLAFFLPSIIGFFACISLMVVSIFQEQTKNKKLHIVLLAAGVIETAILFIYFFSAMTSFSWLPLIAISIVAVAIKCIFMLSRASEVQP